MLKEVARIGKDWTLYECNENTRLGVKRGSFYMHDKNVQGGFKGATALDVLAAALHYYRYEFPKTQTPEARLERALAFLTWERGMMGGGNND